MIVNIAARVFDYQRVPTRLRAEDPVVDEETVADTVERLTGLHQILATIIRAALTDEALAGGLKDRIKAMQGRLERLQQRAAKRREIVRDVMLETDIKKVTAPDFTVSMRPGNPSVVVVDEGAIPQEYWVPREPRLDRHGLLAELKRGAVIPGTELSNAQPVLSVRTK